MAPLIRVPHVLHCPHLRQEVEEDENEEEAEDDVQEDALAVSCDCHVDALSVGGCCGCGGTLAMCRRRASSASCTSPASPPSTHTRAPPRLPLPAPQAGGSKGKKAAPAKKKSAAKGAWVGAVAKTVDGDKFYSKAKVRCARPLRPA